MSETKQGTRLDYYRQEDTVSLGCYNGNNNNDNNNNHNNNNNNKYNNNNNNSYFGGNVFITNTKCVWYINEDFGFSINFSSQK